MKKYINVPNIIEAGVYKESMEDGWMIKYSCQGHIYDTAYSDKEAALHFIEINGGVDKTGDDDIQYADPKPYINTSNLGLQYIENGDYIIVQNGIKRLCKPNEFKENYIPYIDDYIKRIKNIGRIRYLNIPRKVIRKAIKMAKNMSAGIEIFATERSSIQFEIENQNNTYLEIEIFKDRTEIFTNNKSDIEGLDISLNI